MMFFIVNNKISPNLATNMNFFELYAANCKYFAKSWLIGIKRINFLCSTMSKLTFYEKNTVRSKTKCLKNSLLCKFNRIFKILKKQIS